MKRWRMTILGLMGVVAASAAWCAWLSRPTFHAASLAFTTSMTLLLIGIVALCTSRRRTFWVGFVVFGWGYALLAFAPGSWTQVRPYLISSHLLGDLAQLLGHGMVWRSKDIDATRLPQGSGLMIWFVTDQGDRFQRIGHALAAILHGVAGGVLAMILDRRRRVIDASRVGSAIADLPK